VILWSSITIIALIVVESHAAVADLFSKNAILLNEIFDDSLLTLVKPAGDGNDEKWKWIQTHSHRGSLSRPILLSRS